MDTFDIQNFMRMPTDRLSTIEDGLILFDNLNEDFKIMNTILQNGMLKDYLPYSRPFRITFVSIILCRKGFTRFKLDFTDFTLKENEMMYIVPDTIGYIGETIEFSDDCKILVIAIGSRKFEPSISTEILAKSGENILKSGKILMSEDDAEDVISVYGMLRKRVDSSSYSYKTEAARLIIQLLVYDLLSRQPSLAPEQDSKMSRKKQIFNNFLLMVRKNFMQERKISFYADKLCITPKYLSGTVYEVSGRHAAEWIRYYTVCEAKMLLRSGRYTVQQVGDLLNFATPSFFGTYFRKAVGCTPGAYMESSTESSSKTTSA